jgi:hypothetical protein
MDLDHTATARTLPSLVHSYLSAVTDALPCAVRLTQEGEMRLKPGGRWMRFTAAQRFSATETTFEWNARVRLAPGLWIHVTDACHDGRGALDARLLGALRVAHADGPAVTKGQIQRYLAELPWNPGAFLLNEALRLEQTDDHTVVARMQDAEVELQFGADGDIAGAFAMRPRLVGSQTIDTPWRGRFSDYTRMNGMRVPTVAEVEWAMPDGPFVYWRGRVLSAEPEVLAPGSFGVAGKATGHVP